MNISKKDPAHLMDLWEARQSVVNLMGRLSADYVINEQRRMFENYWSHREDVCLGINSGFYRGAEAVKGYYDGWDKFHILVRQLVKNKFPEKLIGKSSEELYGMGTFGYKPIDTPVIEVSDDIKTAKGLWCCRSNYISLESFGNLSWWDWGWIAADFVKEDDGNWKIWHLLMVTEILHPCDQKVTDEMKYRPEVEEFQPIKDFKFPTPNYPYPVRTLYGPGRPFASPPRIPEPYRTFADTFSYGAEEWGII